QQAGGNSSLRFWLSTIVRNTATTRGGGIQSDGGLPVFFNTILAENLTNQTVSNCLGAFSSIGRNLFESLDGCSLTPESDDIVGQSPMLFDLADNGGPTLTHALMDGSPAIDTGMCIPSIMEDQRGTRRVFPCDMGSFETDGMPTVDSGITFTLIDAMTDSPIPGFDPIANGMNILQSDLPDAVNVRANVTGNPGSILFDFNGASNVRVENVAPYALFGDLDGDFLPGVLYEGPQSITARPFSLSDGEGQPMTPQNITFSVVGSKNVITRLVLVDADSDQDVMVLENDITISINDLPANLNVRAEAGPATRSVSFAVGEESRTEVVRPYALFGDLSGDYLNGTVPPGMYELVVTPYDAAGKEGVKMVLRATVTDGVNSNGNKAEFGTIPLPANEAVILSDESADVPAEFSLHKNYPNPFNPTTVIGYSVPQASHIELIVYNLLGQRVQTLVSGTVQAGAHQVSLDATDLPSGIYLYRLITPTGTQTRKMILAK
nr:T9SS type A sorting domain-containing protein [Rhodothermaceae bacterium]